MPIIPPRKISEQTKELGSLDWVDRSPVIKRWFTTWLLRTWRQLYWPSLSKLPARELRRVLDGMDAVLQRLSRTLPKLSSGEQLSAVNAQARRLGLTATHRDLLRHLKLHFVMLARGRRPLDPDEEQALRASPWRNAEAFDRLTERQLGFTSTSLLRHYSHSPDLALNFESVIIEFYAVKISLERPTPRQAERRRRLSNAVRELCGMEQHPRRLARFVARVARECRAVAPEWKLWTKATHHRLARHFNHRRRQILRSHLRSPRAKQTTRMAAMCALFQGIVENGELCCDLVRLHEDNASRLETALAALFQHVRSEVSPTQQARVDDMIVMEDAELRLYSLKDQQTLMEDRLSDLPQSRKLRKSRRSSEYDGKDSLYSQIRKARRSYALP